MIIPTESGLPGKRWRAVWKNRATPMVVNEQTDLEKRIPDLMIPQVISFPEAT
jgi:hypothetical protein